MDPTRVFYSWQSDTPGAANRSLILAALEAAVKEIADDPSIEIVPVVDRDTLDVSGSPDIRTTILNKIEQASVMVADVTIINQGAGFRPTPNPDVLIEVGYALKATDVSRIVLVMNTAFGGPEHLPFDLRQHRVLTYQSDPAIQERAEARRGLTSALRGAVQAVLQSKAPHASRYPAHLKLSAKAERKSQERHDYQLLATFANGGHATLDDWHVTVEVPTLVLPPNVTQMRRVADRSNAKRSLFRMTSGSKDGKALFPDDSRTMSVDFYVDSELFHERSEVFQQPVTARAYAGGKLVDEVTVLFDTLQNF